MRPSSISVICLLGLTLNGCGESARLNVEQGYGPTPTLPKPVETLIPTVNIAPAIGWQNGRTPTPASGLKVQRFATDLQHPRWLLTLPNGDILVAQSNAPAKDSTGLKQWIAGKVMDKAGAGVSSPNRINLLRDADGDGIAELNTPFIEHLNSPFGMALIGEQLYVANTDAIVRYPYRSGQTYITEPGVKVLDLPAGPRNHHWTKNILPSPDDSKLYITTGSNSNVAEFGLEQEQGRAQIWVLDLASGQSRTYASGLRNPNGLDWEPYSGKLWTAVNERDELGSDLVPDYVTSVQDGGFYGWPWSYYGQHVDQRVKPANPQKVQQALVPDYALGAHTASLGIRFANNSLQLPAQWHEGLFVAQHGSWNRKPHSGYKVIFIPFKQGRPNGVPRDVLSGFLDQQQQAQGRPVDVTFDQQGALLISDDVGNSIWRISNAD